MSRPATTLAARLRASSISLPVTRAQRALPLKKLVNDTAKPCITDYVPNPLEDVRSVHESQDQDNIPLMTTYTPFNPGASRPLLPSDISLPPPYMPPPTTHQTPTASHTELTTNHHTTPTTRPRKPWPYALPAFLQPKAGTTFQMLHSSTTATEVKQDEATKRVGILQAILYGVPEPETFSYMERMVEKALYGVKEGEGDKVVEMVEVDEYKEKEKVKEEEEGDVEEAGEDKGGFGMIAK